MKAWKSSLRPWLWSVMLFGALASNARAQDLKCFILTPPEQVLSGVKQIAIADFTVTSNYEADDSPDAKGKKTLDKIIGAVEKMNEAERNKGRFSDSGRKLSDMIISALIENDRGIRDVGTGFLGLGKKEGKSFQTGAYTNVFTVVERGQLQRVIDELQLGQTGIINEATATQVGKLLGVDAMIIGNANVSCVDRWMKEEREDKKKGKYQVDCEKRVANVSASIRIVKVETGQVMGLRDSQNKQEEKKCRGEYGNELPPPEVTVDKCLTNVAQELINYFAPYFGYQKLEFAKIEGDQYKRLAEIAKRALQDYDLSTAYTQYASIAAEDPYNHAAVFNLGVLHEAVGNYRKAQENYSLAFNLRSKEGKYRDSQKRLSKQIEFWDQLNALGIFLTEHEFAVSAAEMSAATMARIETKGPGSVRHEIKASPDAGSATVAKVPGEIELQLLETSGNWLKVKLPDGKEGYLPKDHAKSL